MHIAENLFELLSIFRDVSGLELNKSKTEGMWLGSCRHNTLTPFDIAWPLEPIYALGIYFTYNEHISFEKNFEEKLNSMKNLLNLWPGRNLTLYGLIIILKSLALSKLVYNTLLTFLYNLQRRLKRLSLSLCGIQNLKSNTPR